MFEGERADFVAGTVDFFTARRARESGQISEGISKKLGVENKTARSAIALFANAAYFIAAPFHDAGTALGEGLAAAIFAENGIERWEGVGMAALGVVSGANLAISGVAGARVPVTTINPSTFTPGGGAMAIATIGAVSAGVRGEVITVAVAAAGLPGSGAYTSQMSAEAKGTTSPQARLGTTRLGDGSRLGGPPKSAPKGEFPPGGEVVLDRKGRVLGVILPAEPPRFSKMPAPPAGAIEPALLPLGIRPGRVKAWWQSRTGRTGPVTQFDPAHPNQFLRVTACGPASIMNGLARLAERAGFPVDLGKLTWGNQRWDNAISSRAARTGLPRTTEMANIVNEAILGFDLLEARMVDHVSQMADLATEARGNLVVLAWGDGSHGMLVREIWMKDGMTWTVRVENTLPGFVQFIQKRPGGVPRSARFVKGHASGVEVWDMDFQMRDSQLSMSGGNGTPSALVIVKPKQTYSWVTVIHALIDNVYKIQ